MKCAGTLTQEQYLGFQSFLLQFLSVPLNLSVDLLAAGTQKSIEGELGASPQIGHAQART